jgi:membrane protein DedA with SNARE-associated domain
MNDLIRFLEHLMTILPLELFVFVGTCLDEIISPIPAFLVLVPAGVAAHVQGLPWFYLGVLALISGVARALSGYVLYLLADKLEDVLFANGRKFFGATHKEIETYGKKLGTQTPIKSWLLLFFMHALPVFPGTLLSLGSGFIRLPLGIFASATLFGSAVVAVFFLFLGYSGVQSAELLKGLDSTAQIITVAFVIIVLGWVLWRYRKSKKARQ